MAGLEKKLAFSKWKYRHYFTAIEVKGKNVYVKCTLCPRPKYLSTSVISNSNLLKHLTTAHCSTKLVAKNTTADSVAKDSRPGVANVSSANEGGYEATPSKQLKRKHQAMYNDFVRKKDVKREAYSSGAIQTSASVSGASQITGTFKFDKSDPRQSLISETIVKMIIRDLQPVQTVDNEGFRELLQLLEPRYVPDSSHDIKKQTLPMYTYQVQLATKLALTGAESCSITLDLSTWTSSGFSVVNNTSGYMGVTCHFLTADWQIKSILLSCLPLPNYRDTQHILSDFNEICHSHGILGKVFRIVVNSLPGKSQTAFLLPGFLIHGDVEDEDDEDITDEVIRHSGICKEATERADEHNPLHQCLGQVRINCFAHSLNQCIREGISSSPQISQTLTKAARFYKYTTTSVIPEKLIQVFGSGVLGNKHSPAALEGQWKTQLKTMRQMLESVDFLEDIVDKNDLALNSVEKSMLRELMEVLEPFEEATDMVQGDKHVSISLALPSVLGLRKHLAEVITHHCPGLVAGLAQAIDRRLVGILENPLYVMAASLDPQFKLSWSSDRDWHKQVLLEEVNKHTLPVSLPESSSETQPSPSKPSRLFSFIKDRPTMQAKSIEQELAAYLHEEPTDENPLHYWKRKSIDYPLLSQVAKKVFTIPATTTTVERIFSSVKKTLTSERCRLFPKDLDSLIYLKTNYSILWP